MALIRFSVIGVYNNCFEGTSWGCWTVMAHDKEQAEELVADQTGAWDLAAYTAAGLVEWAAGLATAVADFTAERCPKKRGR